VYVTHGKIMLDNPFNSFGSHSYKYKTPYVKVRGLF
jgi:hypothetical protein